MRNIRLASIAGGVLLGALFSQAFAWSISGVVQDKATGAPIASAEIATFNIAGFSTKSAADGSFSLSEESMAIAGVRNASLNVQFSGNVLSINNVHANVLKVSMIDALGKVTFQRTLHQIHGYVSFDMTKHTARGVKFARINIDGANSSYMLSSKGALLKEGEALPLLMVAKDGYKKISYQMKQDVETGVKFELEVGVNESPSSSSVKSSASDSPKSSSSVDDTPVDCSSKTARGGQDENLSVTVDGKQRTFIMHVPTAYKGDKPVALLVDYHPIGGNSKDMMNSSPYKGKTDPEGVISLYPQGTAGGVGMMGSSAGWNVGPCCSKDDDIAFSRAMIKLVEEKACIDKKRIYAAGFSMGGGMSNQVACSMADVYAAVAPASMDLNKDNSQNCSPARSIPIIMFRGTTDPVCKWDGGDSGYGDGLNFLGAEGNFKFWGEKNGCDVSSESKNSDGCREYSGCKDGVRVVLCVDNLVGGMGPNSHSYGNADIGWPFLKSFTLP